MLGSIADLWIVSICLVSLQLAAVAATAAAAASGSVDISSN